MAYDASPMTRCFKVCAKDFMENQVWDTTISKWKEHVVANISLLFFWILSKQFVDE